MSRLLVFPILLIFVASCTPIYYVPSAPAAPMFREKNEVKVSGTYSQAGQVFDEEQTKGVSLQGAYSITDNIGVMASYMSMKSPDSFSIRGHSNMLQFGVGYYLPINEKFQFEVYGGYGTGNSYAEQNVPAPTVTEFNEYRLSKIFVQPSIGMANEVFEFAFTPGFSYLGLNSKKHFTTPNSEMEMDRTNINQKPSSLFFEPAFTVRVGYKYVKFVLQGMACAALTDNAIRKSDYSMHMGLQFHYARWLQNAGGNKSN